MDSKRRGRHEEKWQRQQSHSSIMQTKYSVNRKKKKKSHRFLFLSFACTLSLPLVAQLTGTVEYTNSCSAQWVSWYDTKQSDGEVPVILQLWEMWSTPSFPLLPDPLWHRVVAPDKVLSMGQIELNCVHMLN